MALSEFSNLSLILYLPDEDSDQQVWDSVRELAKIKCRAEVILVADQRNTSSDHLGSRTSYKPVPSVFPSLDQAISAAKHPLVGILDRDSRVDAPIVQYLLERSEDHAIQTAFFSSPSGLGKFGKVLYWLFAIIARILLNSGKSELRPGFTIINKSLVNSNHWKQVSSKPICSSVQLIAMARLNRLPINEVNLGSCPDVGSPKQFNGSTRSDFKRIRRSLSRTVRFWWNTLMFPRNRFDLTTQLNEKKTSSRKQFAIGTFLILIAGMVLFSSLEFPLFDPDEVRNSQLALNVVETGQWMSLSLGEEYYWDKPPLQIWLIAASYKVFGVSEFTTRLPGALASLLTVLLVLVIGKRLVGFRSASLGALMLTLSTGFVVVGRYVTMDATLTTMSTAALLLGFIAIRERFEKSTAIMAGLACGLGVLVKGPVIAVICIPPLLASSWLLAKEQARNKTRNRWLWFLVPMAIVASPWFIAMALIHPDFLTYFFWKHHIVRFSAAFNHQEPLWYYAVGIFVLMFPASYLLPSVVRFSTSRRPENRMWRTKEHGFLFLSAVWIILFFSLSQSKLPTYIVPAFPLICLLMGVLIERKIVHFRGRPDSEQAPSNSGIRKRTFLEGLPRRAPLELLFWISAISTAIVFLFQQGVTNLAMAISASVIVPLTIFAARKRSNPKLAWCCFGILALFTVVLISHRLIPALSVTRSVHVAANELRISDDELTNSPIVYFGEKPFGARLTVQGELKHFNEKQTQDLVRFLNWNPNAIIVSAKEPIEQLRADLPWTISIEQCKGKRHLYVARPNKAVIAREQQSRLFR